MGIGGDIWQRWVPDTEHLLTWQDGGMKRKRSREATPEEQGGVKEDSELKFKALRALKSNGLSVE